MVGHRWQLHYRVPCKRQVTGKFRWDHKVVQDALLAVESHETYSMIATLHCLVASVGIRAGVRIRIRLGLGSGSLPLLEMC